MHLLIVALEDLYSTQNALIKLIAKNVLPKFWLLMHQVGIHMGYSNFEGSLKQREKSHLWWWVSYYGYCDDLILWLLKQRENTFTSLLPLIITFLSLNILWWVSYWVDKKLNVVLKPWALPTNGLDFWDGLKSSQLVLWCPRWKGYL